MNKQNLKKHTQEELKNSLKHLEYSYKKVQKINLDNKKWDDEVLETLESFAARFARTSDIFISRYLRLLANESDPAFRGSLIDLLNFSEKNNWINSAKLWFRIRELRNAASHDYTAEDLGLLFKELFSLAPEILKIRNLL